MRQDLRKFPPLAADHPMVNEQRCVGCDRKFKEGDVTTLITIGPGDDPEARERAFMGRPYNAVARPVHWACATGEETTA